MIASEVLAAIRIAYPQVALVPEVTIYDEIARATERIEGEHMPVTRRIDALMFSTLQRTAIEVKVSKADASRETWEKVRPWMACTHRFVYVVPAELIEHPPVYGAGLWWVHANGRVEVRRKASINHYPEPLPQGVVQNLAYRASNAAMRAPVPSGDTTP